MVRRFQSDLESGRFRRGLLAAFLLGSLITGCDRSSESGSGSGEKAAAIGADRTRKGAPRSERDRVKPKLDSLAYPRHQSAIWEELLRKYPEIGSGDAAMVALFGSICDGLNDEERSTIARLMTRKLKDPLLGKKFGDSIGDSDGRNSLYAAIIQASDLSRVAELVELVRSIPNDDDETPSGESVRGELLLFSAGTANGSRTTCGEQLLGKLDIMNDAPRVLQAIAAMALDDSDLTHYEMCTASQFKALKGRSLTDAGRQYVEGIRAKWVRDPLAVYLASLELDLKDPSSLARASSNWDVAPTAAFREALTIPTFANELGVGEGFGFSSTFSPEDKEGRSAIDEIMKWLVPRAGPKELAVAINNLPSEELKATHAEALARSYARDYGVDNAREIAGHLDAGSSEAFLRALDGNP